MKLLWVVVLLACLQEFCPVNSGVTRGQGSVVSPENLPVPPDFSKTEVDDREHGTDPEDLGRGEHHGNGRAVKAGAATRSRQKRFVEEPNRLWTNGIVPYIFRSTISDNLRAEAEITMRFISEHSCIRFVPWDNTTAASYNLDHEGKIAFDYSPYGECSSSVGNLQNSDGQTVYCCGREICSHELGHALGWGHEHMSVQRDGWVRINWQNLTADEANWYAKRNAKDRTFFEYDLSTTMHYKASYNGGPIGITVLFPELPIERAYFYFFKEIARAYQCKENNCSSFTTVCENEGFVTMVKGTCQCLCPDGLDPATGCTTTLTQALAPSEFPGGQYAMLTSLEGCPGSTTFQTGTVTHYHYRTGYYPPVLVQGDMGGGKAEQHFCVRNSSENNVKWPSGHYCIYRVGGSCPEGFGTGWLQYDNAPPTATEYTQTSGSVPDGDYGDDVKFYFCCRDDEYPGQAISLPSTEPFVLLRPTGSGCPDVKGMSSLSSYVWVKHSSTETGTAMSSDNRPYVYHSSDSVFLGYCYYYPVNHNCGGVIELSANQRTAAIMSPNYPADYDNNLDCTWVIKGPANSTLVLDIQHMDIHCGDELRITHGKIGHNPLSYCGTERKQPIRSVTNMMRLQLRTSSSTQRAGFNATVSVHLDEEACYNPADRGASYRGHVNYTRDNEPCVPWFEVPHCYHYTFRATDLSDGLDGNYCRNPGDGLRPWCYTDPENCVRNYCDVCHIERPFDQFDDCSAIQSEGLCSEEYLARKGCSETCKDSLPALPTPVTYSAITCSSPPTPYNAAIVSGAKAQYSVGDVITYQCNTSSDQVTSTCLTDGTWTPVGYVCGGCPSGWSAYKERCYKRFLELKTFSGASASCASLNATLATAKSQEEADLLFDIGDRDGDMMWLGLWEETEGDWRWADGTHVSWANWESGHPNVDPSKNCGRVDASKEWTDVPCSATYIYACVKEPNERVGCTDRRPDCAALVEEFPTLCQDQMDTAWLMCPSTCGFCRSMECPPGWDEYRGACYDFSHSSALNYEDAEAECASLGATISTAKDEGEFTFLRAHVSTSTYYWLGAHDKETEGVWKWNDGTYVTFNNWIIGDPNDIHAGVSDVDCLMMDRQGRWMDNDCATNTRLFVCKTTLGCPSDWSEFRGACYKFHSKLMTYAEAESTCASYGDDVILTTAKDEAEFNFTKSILDEEGRPYWLGLDDRATEGEFLWADGTSVGYNVWNTAEPNDLDLDVPGADCAQVGSNGLWKDTSCDKSRRFTCKWAGQCVAPAPTQYATASIQAGSALSRGQYVTYTCAEGYVPISGNAIRTCLKHGILTGSDLVCGAETEVTTESSDVILRNRQHLGSAGYSYTGTAPHLQISRNGDVTAWKFYSKSNGQVALQVYRPRPDLGSASYELVGQNVITTTANRLQTVSVQSENRIHVQRGDVLGIYYGQTPGGVPFEKCAESQAAEGLSVMKSTGTTSDPSSLTPGTVVQFDNNPQCLIFSFRAVIGP